MRIAEPDVTLTDLLLAIECLVLAWLLAGLPRDSGLQPWFILAFASIGISAVLGAVLHGFLTDRNSTAHKRVWRSIIMLLGVTGLTMWILGSRILLGQVASGFIGVIAAATLVLYIGITIVRHPPFSMALAYYVPAAIFLVIAFTVAALRESNAVLLTGTAGMGLSLVAAWVQHKRIGWQGRLLGHNALYHVIQAIALLLIYWVARELLRTPPGTSL